VGIRELRVLLGQDLPAEAQAGPDVGPVDREEDNE
jgi:hypothetical protein